MRKRSLPQPEERTERRISAATSLSICALTVIAQIVLTLALTQLLAEKISYVYFILELAGAVVAIWVYLRPGSPSYKLVWMCLLLALPVAGMILFLLWGGSHQAKSLSLRKVAPPVEREGARQASAANVAHLSRRSPAWGRLASYLQSRDFLLYGGSQARYFAEGADFFDDLVLHLQRAEIYIFLEYYILAEGQICRRRCGGADHLRRLRQPHPLFRRLPTGPAGRWRGGGGLQSSPPLRESDLLQLPGPPEDRRH